MTEFLKQIPDAAQSFGEITDEISEILDELDEELMKRGTLAVDSIDWPELRKKAEALLPQICHLQGYRALIVAMTAPEPSGLIQETSLTGAFAAAQHLTEKAWPDMHPQGPRLKRKRDAWLNDIIQALGGAVEDVSAQGGLSRNGVKSAEKLIKALKKNEIDSVVLERALKDQPEDLPEAPAAPKAGAMQSSKLAQSAPPSTHATPQRLDAKGRADLRRDIQALADRISHHEADAGIAWLMRGYASWLEYAQAPEKKDETGLTDQPAMPAFVAGEHLKNATSPDMAALKKLEDRLFMSPDWFDGQKLAAEMALRLDMPQSAAAICRRVRDRLEQVPELKELKHQNGTDIVSEEIQTWVAANTTSVSGTGPAGATEDIGGDETGDALAEAEARISAARSPREAALAQLSFARALIASGHPHHAKLIAENLARRLSPPTLQEWDSHLLEEIENLQKTGE
ncbi:type VI secretion system domain-containing protein [Halocynthiibacter sp.]|uniref:type VI secretion system domain-containing protein n=1 Tax=Halocynthiibacter sp. TaxID=1979210 RepID=UPI003C363DCA